jgi:ADP-ribose pyrophosphatase YjhB (NUDIX family)
LNKNKDKLPKWLEWAREIQALSQTGLAFCQSEYDKQRFTRLMEIAAEIASTYSHFDKEMLVDNFLSQPGYATPKVDIRGAVIRDNKILLVQEKSDGKWCMPGGWADVGESASQAVAREVLEESGFIVNPVKVVFMCELTGGKAATSNETTAVDFFDFKLLPPLSSNRTNEKYLAEVFAHHQDKNRATWFD